MERAKVDDVRLICGRRGLSVATLAAITAFAWPGAAQAAITCSESTPQTLIISIGLGDTATVTRDGSGVILGGTFFVNGVACTHSHQIHAISVTGVAGGSQHLVLQLPLQRSGSGGQVPWVVNLGDGSGDSMQINGVSGIDKMVMGDAGIDFDARFDTARSKDITTITGVETLAFNGAGGADILSGAGDSTTGAATSHGLTLIGGTGNDTIIGGAAGDFFPRDADDDTYDGRGGADMLGNDGATSGVTADLGAVNGLVNTGGFGTDHTTAMESASGTPFPDVLLGTSGPNTLLGFGGDDRLVGRGGIDNLQGGDANDTLLGGSAADKVIGNAGLDTVDYSAEAAGVIVALPFGPVVVPSGNDALNSIEGVIGTAFADTLAGGAEGNVFHGLASGDVIRPGGGDDDVFGETGTDTVDYSSASAVLTVALGFFAMGPTIGTDDLSGIENAIGGADQDSLIGDSGPNRLDGRGGADTVNGMGGDDRLLGGDGAGADRLFYSSAPSAVTADLGAGTSSGGFGSDTISGFENVSGSGHDDHLIGDTGPNDIDGTSGNDTVEGAGGSDTFRAEPGHDSFDGGPGDDTVSYSTLFSPVLVDLATGVAASTGGPDDLAAVEIVVGSNSDDVLAGNALPNTFLGGGGNDTYRGRGGDDHFTDSGGPFVTNTVSYSDSPGPVNVNLASQTATGDGSDSFSGINAVEGSPSGDTLTGGTAGGTLRGLGGADTINGGTAGETFVGGAGNDALTSGGGSDVADYGGAPGPVTVRLDLGTATGDGDDTLTGFTAANGSPFNDVLVGTIGLDTLRGGAGNDVFFGGPSVDSLFGELGSDFLVGGGGSDVLSGGEDPGDTDHDVVDYEAAPVAVTVDLGTASVADGTGTDTISGFENVNGSAFADTLTGDGAANVLNGFAGNDTLTGLAGADTLNGMDGNDTLDGGADTDVCNQNAGSGTKTGCESGS